jgi:hypothetical protein
MKLTYSRKIFKKKKKTNIKFHRNSSSRSLGMTKLIVTFLKRTCLKERDRHKHGHTYGQRQTDRERDQNDLLKGHSLGAHNSSVMKQGRRERNEGVAPFLHDYCSTQMNTRQKVGHPLTAVYL